MPSLSMQGGIIRWAICGIPGRCICTQTQCFGSPILRFGICPTTPSMLIQGQVLQSRISLILSLLATSLYPPKAVSGGAMAEQLITPTIKKLESVSFICPQTYEAYA